MFHFSSILSQHQLNFKIDCDFTVSSSQHFNHSRFSFSLFHLSSIVHGIWSRKATQISSSSFNISSFWFQECLTYTWIGKVSVSQITISADTEMCTKSHRNSLSISSNVNGTRILFKQSPFIFHETDFVNACRDEFAEKKLCFYTGRALLSFFSVTALTFLLSPSRLSFLAFMARSPHVSLTILIEWYWLRNIVLSLCFVWRVAKCSGQSSIYILNWRSKILRILFPISNRVLITWIFLRKSNEKFLSTIVVLTTSR